MIGIKPLDLELGSPLNFTSPKHSAGGADQDSMGRPAAISRDALERFLGEGQSYAIARLPGLKAALSWNCGCRAIEHDAGGFTLITCDRHRNSSMRSASIVPFQ